MRLTESGRAVRAVSWGILRIVDEIVTHRVRSCISGGIENDGPVRSLRLMAVLLKHSNIVDTWYLGKPADEHAPVVVAK